MNKCPKCHCIDLTELPKDHHDDYSCKYCGYTFKDYVEETLEISDKDFIILAKEAHKRDITLNELINDVLEKYVQERKNEIS